ncbi:hypothetical protein C6T69_24080 [Burkholderia multivorans]|nr:hypothetical protein C6T69_24080 [Burkholderia multivorans]
MSGACHFSRLHQARLERAFLRPASHRPPTLGIALATPSRAPHSPLLQISIAIALALANGICHNALNAAHTALRHRPRRNAL